MIQADATSPHAQPDAQSQDQSGDERVAPSKGLLGRAREALSRAGEVVAGSMLPPLCLACQVRIDAHDSLCPACWHNVTFIRPPLCDRLGIPLPYDIGTTMISAAAEANPPDYDRARAVAAFTGPVRDLIHTFKFRDTQHARRLFGRWMCEAGGDLLKSADLIVPVPLARSRLFFRRFNQAQILAAELSRHSGKPTNPFALARIKATPQQTRLTRAERRRNVAGAFSVPLQGLSTIAGKNVLLIDDVITTGATASSAARTLKKAGANRVDVLVLALVVDTLSQS